MPYILAPIIKQTAPDLWQEGPPYSIQNIYDIECSDPKKPPVHYNAYTLKPHSIVHMDAPAHIISGGKKVTDYFVTESFAAFFGKCAVVKITPQWQNCEKVPGNFVHRISVVQLKAALQRVLGVEKIPDKIIIAPDPMPTTSEGFHDQKYAFVLDEEAAQYIVSNSNFNFYGVSWKSTDYQPGLRERPIHKIILSQAIIYECLDLNNVPEGIYFVSAFPLPLDEASESPACPVLFTQEELRF